jgi:hypothetical protein
MFPTWVYLVAAATIALVAFGLGQIVPGLGIWFAIPATMMWVAWSANHQRKVGPRS